MILLFYCRDRVLHAGNVVLWGEWYARTMPKKKSHFKMLCRNYAGRLF